MMTDTLIVMAICLTAVFINNITMFISNIRVDKDYSHLADHYCKLMSKYSALQLKEGRNK